MKNDIKTLKTIAENMDNVEYISPEELDNIVEKRVSNILSAFSDEIRRKAYGYDEYVPDEVIANELYEHDKFVIIPRAFLDAIAEKMTSEYSDCADCMSRNKENCDNYYTLGDMLFDYLYKTSEICPYYKRVNFAVEDFMKGKFTKSETLCVYRIGENPFKRELRKRMTEKRDDRFKKAVKSAKRFTDELKKFKTTENTTKRDDFENSKNGDKKDSEDKNKNPLRPNLKQNTEDIVKGLKDLVSNMDLKNLQGLSIGVTTDENNNVKIDCDKY